MMFGRHRKALDELNHKVTLLLERSHRTMSQLTDLITALNDNTNLVAAKLDHLVGELATAGVAPTVEQLAALQAVSDHLKAIGADPASPIPVVPFATDPAPLPPVV